MPAVTTQAAQKRKNFGKQTIGSVKPHQISAKRTIKADAFAGIDVPAIQNTGKRTNGWTEERHRKQAAAIRRWQPWAHSTGPCTVAGKETSRLNATKHGGRSAAARRFLKDLVRWRAFRRLAVRAVEARLHPDDLAIVLHQIHAATLARSAENFSPQRRKDHKESQSLCDPSCPSWLCGEPSLLPAAQIIGGSPETSRNSM